MGRGKSKGKQQKGLSGPKESRVTAELHPVTPLDIDLDINNERQLCKQVQWGVGYLWAGEGEQKRFR
jgi:hypothetical protein